MKSVINPRHPGIENRGLGFKEAYQLMIFRESLKHGPLTLVSLYLDAWSDQLSRLSAQFDPGWSTSRRSLRELRLGKPDSPRPPALAEADRIYARSTLKLRGFSLRRAISAMVR